jgi:hypothetical protein
MLKKNHMCMWWKKKPKPFVNSKFQKSFPIHDFYNCFIDINVEMKSLPHSHELKDFFFA